MDNFSGWLREKLLEYDPEHQIKLEKKHTKHGYHCIPCDKIDWFNRKLLADYHSEMYYSLISKQNSLKVLLFYC